MKHCNLRVLYQSNLMRKTFALVIFSAFVGNMELFSQYTSMTCPHDTLSPHPDSLYNASPCLNVQEILDELDGGDNCRQIWINMNVHFFVDDGALTSLITPSGHTTSEANTIAEDLINSANYMLYLNETQINQTGAIKLCNPIQYVLKGVYIHIVSTPDDVDALYDLDNMYATYGVNKSTEFNLFISPCTGCSGIAGGLGGTTTYLNVSLLWGQVLNHEWGHTMGLGHSWINDGISDTPPISFNVDRNCDGDYNDAKETGQQCFGKITSGGGVNTATDQIGTTWNGAGSGRWYNGVNDCSESSPCPVSQCCSDDYQNNNVMAYNSCQCSFTYLQLKKVLEQLVSYKCDYINTIQTDRGCWAPSAFISLPLPNKSNYGDCSTCFDLSASYNDQKHLIRVYEINGGTPTLVYTSGWVSSPASKICFKNYGVTVGSGRYLKSNQYYRIDLSVGRTDDCISPATFSRYFTTSSCDPDPSDPPITFAQMIVAPNPATTTTELTFDAFEGEEFSIFAVNQGNAQLSLLCNSMYASSEGENEYEVSVNSLSNGTYTIFMIGVDHYYYKTVVKY